VLGLESIKWNFTKFLINKSGEPVKRYAPPDKPESLEADIEAALTGAAA
jgi:glutathione peroxidase